MGRSTSTRTGKKGGGLPAGLDRAKMVWLALMGSMTCVGGLLLLLEGRPAPRLDGLALSPLAAASVTSQIESIYGGLRSPLARPRWQAIIIHHSGSNTGSPASIATEHEARNFKGLGHHFVIGNGNGMTDGEIHAGFRWMDQLPGAHAAGAKGDWYNQHAISICLVGNGNRRDFTKAQIDSLSQLVASLRRELEIPADRVYRHSDIAPVNDPGILFPSGEMFEQIRSER